MTLDSALGCFGDEIKPQTYNLLIHLSNIYIYIYIYKTLNQIGPLDCYFISCAHLHSLQPKQIDLPHFFVSKEPNMSIVTLDCY